MQETAYAKINLALHVRRRREDGYHELETLFAFVDRGDTLNAHTAEQDKVTTIGEFAEAIWATSPFPGGEGPGEGAAPLMSEGPPPPNLPPDMGRGHPFDNLVARALNALPRPQGLNIALEKNLPVAAGLGGGSADAGAVFRLVERLHGLPDDWPTRAAKLGADVPACVASRTCIGRGTGTQLEPADESLKGTPVLLINPRIPLSTGPVFQAWNGEDLGPLPSGAARQIAENGRNDLTEPALTICPQIADVLEELSRDASWKVEMSGSGATCFALYSDIAEREKAARRIASAYPMWWQMAGKLR